MTIALEDRYDDRIVEGAVLLRPGRDHEGHLTVCYAGGMTVAARSGMRIFDYPAFAATLRER